MSKLAPGSAAVQIHKQAAATATLVCRPVVPIGLCTPWSRVPETAAVAAASLACMRRHRGRDGTRRVCLLLLLLQHVRCHRAGSLCRDRPLCPETPSTTWSGCSMKGAGRGTQRKHDRGSGRGYCDTHCWPGRAARSAGECRPHLRLPQAPATSPRSAR